MVESCGHSRDEAELDICNALADRKIPIRPEILQIYGSRGLPLGAPALRVPRRLTPRDFDWKKSVTVTPWQENMNAIALRRLRDTRSARQIILSIELSTRDVVRVLCAGRLPSQAPNEDSRSVPSKSATESVATKALASQLRDNPDLKRADAKTWCAAAGYQLSARGFQSRVWPGRANSPACQQLVRRDASEGNRRPFRKVVRADLPAGKTLRGNRYASFFVTLIFDFGDYQLPASVRENADVSSWTSLQWRGFCSNDDRTSCPHNSAGDAGRCCQSDDDLRGGQIGPFAGGEARSPDAHSAGGPALMA
jgi:hypothetical protein